MVACEVDDLLGDRLNALISGVLASHQRIEQHNQSAEPGATDNPGDAQ